MDLERQWCAQPTCADFGKVAAGNLKIHSYTERRMYCTTCLHTFSADTGTFFETLRSERDVILHVLALLSERNSLRAVERLTRCRPNTALHWLDLAGQHARAVSAELIHHLHLRQVQIDELWTFVKKSKSIVSTRIPSKWAICGFGVRSRYPAASASSVISAMNGAKPTPPRFWRNSRHVPWDAHPCSPATNCPPMSKP